MPAPIIYRTWRCPRSSESAGADARAHYLQHFAMPALQDTDARAVNSQYLRCPRFKTRMPALRIRSTCDARASRYGCRRCEVTVLAMPALQDTDARASRSAYTNYGIHCTIVREPRRPCMVDLAALACDAFSYIQHTIHGVTYICFRALQTQLRMVRHTDIASTR